jgi:hypothetical protein
MIKFISKILSSIIALVFLSSNAFSIPLSMPKIGIIEPIKSENVILAHRETNVIEGYFDNGNRAYKKVSSCGSSGGSSTTYYVHDGVHVIAEYSHSGTDQNPVLTKEYVYSGNVDEALSTKTVIPDSDPESYSYSYYHQDGLNSVTAITDSTRAVVQSYNYKAFGSLKDVIPDTDPGSSYFNQITYTGRWLEPETGDYFYRARYYDSTSGF